MRLLGRLGARRAGRKAPGLVIAAARPEDGPVLCRLFNAARAGAEGLPDGTVDVAGFRALIAGEDVLVARIDGAVAGFVSVWPREGFIHHLYVAPAWQGRGIGAALLARCERDHGLPLALKCVQANARARRFYERNGFVADGTGVGSEGVYVRYRKAPPR